MECALPSKTLWNKGRHRSSAWLRGTNPSVHTLALDTSSKMGARSPSPATPNANWRCSSERSATLPAGVAGYGGGGYSHPFRHHYLHHGCEGVDRVVRKTKGRKPWHRWWSHGLSSPTRCPPPPSPLPHGVWHKRGLPGNYLVFTVVMVIYHYVKKIGELLFPLICLYNI